MWPYEQQRCFEAYQRTPHTCQTSHAWLQQHQLAQHTTAAALLHSTRRWRRRRSLCAW